MFRNLYNSMRKLASSMATKLVLGVGLIVVALLVSVTISTLEYSRMNTYVSDLIAENIANINAAQSLASLSNKYNLDLLTVIGDDGQNVRVPSFNQNDFLDRCEDLKSQLADASMLPLADSVVYSYSAYMLTSLELPQILLDDFTDTRDWYFGRLQPKYNRLRTDIDNLTDAIYTDLQKNSFTFQRGFYRSVIPGIVAVGVAILLLLLFLSFILSYYVRPVYGMLKNLRQHADTGRAYKYEIDGDDQITELNDHIRLLTDENIQMKQRIKALKGALESRNNAQK